VKEEGPKEKKKKCGQEDINEASREVSAESERKERECLSEEMTRKWLKNVSHSERKKEIKGQIGTLLGQSELKKKKT
jgi:hypothetical protein